MNNLVKAFQSLPPLIPKTVWDKHCLALRKHVARKKGNGIDKFLRWPTIRATMFVGEAPFIRGEYDVLMEDASLWRAAIRETKVGAPLRLSYAKWTSGNLVNQAYHLKQWMDVTSKSVADLDSIVEIGGGYGAMALLTRRMGFDGQYELVDRPEFGLLQKYYLTSVGLGPDANISWPLPHQHNLLSPHLVIALFSVSEVPLAKRMNLMPRDAQSYLIAYQLAWQGMNNQKYFNQFVAERSDLAWQNWSVEFGSMYWYLVGYNRRDKNDNRKR